MSEDFIIGGPGCPGYDPEPEPISGTVENIEISKICKGCKFDKGEELLDCQIDMLLMSGICHSKVPADLGAPRAGTAGAGQLLLSEVHNCDTGSEDKAEEL